jgi:hypothetical protein
MMIGLGVAAPHTGEMVDWRSFLHCLLGTRTADTERSSPISINAVGANDVLFWSFINIIIPWGSYPSKAPHF